ncbi:MAG: hypothetical protein PHF86_01930 [Candidatus Nanoarchaeia archaeon]|nr:hypothetical protein [Candidatus Nanoarchaeia archaeon]
MKIFKSLKNPTPEKRIALRQEMKNNGFYFSSFDKVLDAELFYKENSQIKVVEELWTFEKRDPIPGLDDIWV